MSLIAGAIFVATLGLAVVMAGAVATTAEPMLVLGYLTLICSLPLFFFPSGLFFILLLLSLFVSGILESFGRISQANWLPSLAGFMLWAAVFIERVSKRTTTEEQRRNRLSNAHWYITIPVMIYVVSMLISTVINRAPVVQIISGARNYLPFISVLMYFMLTRRTPQTKKVVVELLVAIGAVQFIFCILQQLYIVPQRRAILGKISGEAEAIVGTFGGNPMLGGYTGEMAVFTMCCAIAALFLRSSFSNYSLQLRVTAGLSFLVSVALAETKVVFILLPIVTAVCVSLYPEKISHGVRTGLTGIVVAFITLSLIYYIRYWSVREGEFFHAFFYTFDSNFMVSETERGRVGAILYWWDSMMKSGDIMDILFGFGANASNGASTVGGIGKAVQLYGPGLDASALTKLLWDFGAVGLFSFLFIFAGSLMAAIKAARMQTRNVEERILLSILTGWTIALLLMVPYQVSVIGGGAMQFFLWVTLGLIFSIVSTEPNSVSHGGKRE